MFKNHETDESIYGEAYETFQIIQYYKNPIIWNIKDNFRIEFI